MLTELWLPVYMRITLMKCWNDGVALPCGYWIKSSMTGPGIIWIAVPLYLSSGLRIKSAMTEVRVVSRFLMIDCGD